MKETNGNECVPLGDNPPFPADLFEKARLVHERMTELGEDLDRSVFIGMSKDGSCRIALHGDGRPESVSLGFALPEGGRKHSEEAIFEALDAVWRCRLARVEEGLDDIQRETGAGPGLELPF